MKKERPPIAKSILEVDGRSLASPRRLAHPSNQRSEDSCFYEDYSPILGVFDGVGGESYGDIASGVSAARMSGQVKDACRIRSVTEGKTFLAQLIKQMSVNVVFLSMECLPPGRRMASTAAVALFVESDAGWQIITAHLGDSRVYLWCGGKLRQLTADHNVTALVTKNQLAAMLLNRNLVEVNSLDDLQGAHRVWAKQLNVITRSVGGDDDEPTIAEHPFPEGAWAMLTTDGVHGRLRHSLMERILKDQESPEMACHVLVEAVHTGQYGGEKIQPTLFSDHPDDATVVIARLKRQ
jgi:serine/threonine protein phosphatase PrpC